VLRLLRLLVIAFDIAIGRGRKPAPDPAV